MGSSSPLASLRGIVAERAERLRRLSFHELEEVVTSTEELVVESRPATIQTMQFKLPSGKLQVTVRGVMKARLIGKDVVLDGFYKHRDGSIVPMSEDDLRQIFR